MIEIQKNKGPLQLLFIVFILIQPLLDTIYLYSESVIGVLGFSPSTILRFTGVGVLLVALLFAKWVPNKAKMAAILYLGIVLIYFICHHLAAGSFVLENGKQMDYSMLSEFFYVCRLTLPILLVFIAYYIELSLNQILRLFVWISLIMSGIIIVSNLFCVSLDSYTNETIKANIFSWFTNGYEIAGFNGLASKGFFYFANQTAAVFMLLYPLVFLVIVRQKSLLAGITLVLQCIAMIMLGTKISTFGVVMVAVACLAAYLFFVIIRKEKWNAIALVCSCLVLLLCVVLVPRSPAVFRLDVHNNTVEMQDSQSQTENTGSPLESSLPSGTTKPESGSPQPDQTESENPNGEEDKSVSSTAEQPKTGETAGPQKSMSREEKLDYIREHYKKINTTFILEAYPYEYDPDFWYAMLQQPAEKRIDNRFIEMAMIERAKELGGSTIHTLFGISYEKMTSFFNIERDLVSQYYSMGIIGLILFFGPFFFLLFAAIYQLFRKFKKNFNLTNVLMIASLAIVLLAGYISGNTLDNLFVTILIGVLCGGCVKNYFPEFPETNKKQD